MNRMISKKFILRLLISVVLLSGTSAFAVTPDELLKGYALEAKQKEFSASAGKTFFLAEQKTKKGEMVSCATCHTSDPTKSGKSRAGKVIEPMAVSANEKRFTDKAKVEKWFKRNCNDVYERNCTALEKGNFIAFMKNPKI